MSARISDGHGTVTANICCEPFVDGDGHSQEREAAASEAWRQRRRERRQEQRQRRRAVSHTHASVGNTHEDIGGLFAFMAVCMRDLALESHGAPET